MRLAGAMRSALLAGVVVFLGPPGCSSGTKDPNPPAQLSQGERIYRAYCAGCHGASGRGDGPAGAAMVPRPTDFFLGPWKRGRTAEAIRRSILEGVPPTMKSTTNLTGEELDALVEHVLALTAGTARP